MIRWNSAASARALLELSGGDETAREVAAEAWTDLAQRYFYLESAGLSELGLCGVRPHSGDPVAFAAEIDLMNAFAMGALR